MDIKFPREFFKEVLKLRRVKIKKFETSDCDVIDEKYEDYELFRNVCAECVNCERCEDIISIRVIRPNISSNVSIISFTKIDGTVHEFSWSEKIKKIFCIQLYQKQKKEYYDLLVQ